MIHLDSTRTRREETSKGRTAFKLSSRLQRTEHHRPPVLKKHSSSLPGLQKLVKPHRLNRMAPKGIQENFRDFQNDLEETTVTVSLLIQYFY